MHLHSYFKTIHSALLQNCFPDLLNLECQWGIASSQVSYQSMYQNVTEGKFAFFDQKNFQSCLKPTLWNSVSAPPFLTLLNTLLRERPNHSQSCVKVKVSRRPPKIEIYLARERSGLAFFRMVLHSLVCCWEKFSVAMLAMISEIC